MNNMGIRGAAPCTVENPHETFLKNVCVFILSERDERERERAPMQAGEGQREREREREPSRFYAISTEPNMELDPTEL